jgi:hypothetical protein
MSLAEKVDPKTDALSLYHTIFELEAALKVPRPTDEKVLLRSAWHWLTTLAVHANSPTLTAVQHRRPYSSGVRKTLALQGLILLSVPR